MDEVIDWMSFYNRQRLPRPVPRAADVLATAHLGRIALGDHLPGRDLAARGPLRPHACALRDR